jgi:1-phosphatidylinositol-4-phosphate 5-kinase
MKINDYSVLLGIHYLQPSGKAAQKRAKQIVDASPNLDILYVEGIKNQLELQYDSLASRDLNDSIQVGDQEILPHQRKRPERAFFESQEGGLVSEDGSCIYFMGIIDILTGFGKKKVLENFGKSIIYDKYTISCVPPVQYGDRFFAFMRDKVFFGPHALKDRQQLKK